MRKTVLLAVVVTACGSRTELPARAAVRDSAGVTIVENVAPLAPDSVAMVVDSAGVLEIGGSGDPRTEFGRVSGVMRLRGGVIVVADGGNSELRFFDSTGGWLRTIGRKGGGPAEFDMIGGLYRLASDSLAVYDINHRRISVFEPGGVLKRETVLPGGPEEGFPTVVGILDDDLLIRTDKVSQALQSGTRRDTMAILRYPRWAAPSVSLGRFPGWELHVEVRRNSGGQVASTMSSVLPFGRILTLGTSAGRLLVGTGDRYEIASYDSSGRLARLVRRAGPAVPVTDADIAVIRQQWLEGFRPGQEAQRERVREILAGMTFHSTKPAYDGFVVGDDGSLWIRRYDQPAEDLPARYDVFDPDGQWLGHVMFPPRFVLYHAGPGYALGVWRDPDDVERVRLYPLQAVPR